MPRKRSEKRTMALSTSGLEWSLFHCCRNLRPELLREQHLGAANYNSVSNQKTGTDKPSILDPGVAVHFTTREQFGRRLLINPSLALPPHHCRFGHNHSLHDLAHRKMR